VDGVTRPLYLIDTNITAYIASGRSQSARSRLKVALEDSTVMISAITQAEILSGLERRPDASRLRSSMEALLNTLRIRPWDSSAAVAYGKLRAGLNAAGKTLTLMDLLIASHAVAASAILVTHDQAFQHLVPLLSVVDWATDL
jgi:tRNA(fMet)-specific endonuclease VapC